MTGEPQSFRAREREMDALEHHLKNSGIDARVTEIVDATTAIVSGSTYADFLFARSLLERQGWRVLQPAQRPWRARDQTASTKWKDKAGA